MRTAALQPKRNQEILAAVVRAYIETGEPISSRAIARLYPETLSPATIRNIMADLEEEGYLFQPHTSAGRVPTASAYRFFVEEIATQGTVSQEDRDLIHRELACAQTPEALMERASHVLAAVSRGLGIIVAPPLAKTPIEHLKFMLLPDGRVLVVLISAGGAARDKLIRPERPFTQPELDQIADHLNRHYAGWTLAAIRADLQAQIARDRRRYEKLAGGALLLCDLKLLEDPLERQLYVEGAAQIATALEFTDQAQLRELLATIEERSRLISLLSGFIELPEPLHVEFGLKEISSAGKHLVLVTAPYLDQDHIQGTLGILGPMRMHYERVITAVAFMAELMTHNLKGSDRS